MSPVVEKILAGLQYPLPHHLLSRLIHRLMRAEAAWLKNLLIRRISQAAGINWSEAILPDAKDYPHFNAFFTRELKPGSRPLAGDQQVLTSPSDGHVSELGNLDQDRIFQAKGHSYTASSLLGDDPSASQFTDGRFITIYLSPRDYHRVHMPIDGTLTRMIHIPGRLFSVAPYTVRQVPELFARNERVACLFDTAIGPVAVVLVGALLVASIETIWAGEITPPAGKKITTTEYAAGEVQLAKGDEMGRFNMGSTVVMLLPEQTLSFESELQAGSPLKMGQSLGTLVS